MNTGTRIKGTVGRSDLEGGYFTFTSGKTTWKLEGGGPDLRKKGVQAEVHGNVEGGMMGIGFGSPVLTVKSYKIL